MDDTTYLKGLNQAQKEAVLLIEGPLLIVAGAGAGKTKTITHRITHLIATGVPGRNILAVTFTNKAAGEMRERVRKLLAGRADLPLLCTFHSLGARILREFHHTAGIPNRFTIWDRDDSSKALKTILAKIDSDLSPKSVLAAISRAKGDDISGPEYAEHADTYWKRSVARVWDLYDKTLRDEGALDFDDLLLRTLELLRNSPEVLALLRSRWSHLTIDEYQDTNKSQMEIARLLAGEKKNICVVGDIDQCLAAGTQITMADGSRQLIETVTKGDMILSNYGSGDIRSARVGNVFSKKALRLLIRISTAKGRVITSTPEHIHFAGYRLGLAPQKYFTYLMYKREIGWRLGVSQVYTEGQKKPMVGFQQRCNQEHGDSVWIIAAHQTPNDARVLEYILSLKYRIPTLPFVARKGVSRGGYVHDQKTLNHVFASFNTALGAQQLLDDYGLSLHYPHHRAQASHSSRKNIVVTLCGDRRGVSTLHRISLVGSDAADRDTLVRARFSVRPAKRGSSSWRFETAHKDYGTIHDIARRIQLLFPDAHIIETARLGGHKDNPRDGNSLPFLPAGSVLPGMAMFDESGNFDIVEKVEHIDSDTTVYDLNIERTHNFIANGLVTHNSIYTWRGADIEHLLGFEKNFPGAKMITLEENYRSTRTILAAANAVIEKNVRRKPKTLFTQNETGSPIHIFGAQNEIDEAWFVAQSAAELFAKGTSPRNIAVLYRENFQSRALEEAFLHGSIPYRVLGTRFFERKEVKDVLAYLRASLNPRSRNDIARIVTSPPRGIGKITLEKMFSNNDASIPRAARARVEAFRELLTAIRKAVETVVASDAVHFTIRASGIETMLKKDQEEGAERLGNVRELVNLATKYDDALPPRGIEALLEEAALQSEQDELDQSTDRGNNQEAVSLMTVHASKGLEFDTVFVTGLEQGLFPSERMSDPPLSGERGGRDPEEERRLFYVAITRAAKRLYLSFARARMKYGSREHAIPSEFLDDIDPRLMINAGNPEVFEEKIIE